MRTGTALSVMLHGALVALTLMSWPDEPLEPPQEFNTVDVEMVTIAEETNTMAAEEPSPGPPAAAPAPPPPPPAAEPAEAAPPPPRPPEPPLERQAALPPKTEPRPQTRTKPEPKPEPKKPEPKRPEPRPEPKREEAKKPEPKKPEPPKPEPKKPEPVREAKKPVPKKPEPKQPEKKPEKPTQTAAAEPKKPEKPKPKKDEFNLDDIGAAADKLAKTQPEKPAEPAKPQASGPRSAAGQGTKMTSTEIDALRSTISQCWNVPAGAPNPETLVVRLKLFLNQDGTVARQPELVDTAGRAGSDPYFRAAAEAAVRAVQVCAPYRLPADKYDDWSEITINFRPPF